MLAVTYSVALIGVQAEAITIEVNSGERGELRESTTSQVKRMDKSH